MVLEAPNAPLRATEIPDPQPGPGDVLIEIAACGVCRTDLHVVDGELRGAEAAARARPPDRRAGRRRRALRGWAARWGSVARVDLRRVPLLPLGPREPLRPCALHRLPARRRLRGGGGRRRALLLPDPRRVPRPPGRPAALRRADRLPGAAHGGRGASGSASTASGPRPTSCARSRGTRGGACSPSRRADDSAAQEFARELGAEWAGDALGPPPEELDAAIVFAPVGELVPAALRAVAKGGTVVCAGIHMSDLPSMPYELLWGERTLRSVANLTRADGEEFMALAPRVPVRTEVESSSARAGERGARPPARRRGPRRRGARALSYWSAKRTKRPR